MPREGLRRDTSARNVPRHFQDKVKIPQELEREQVLWCLGALVVNCIVRDKGPRPSRRPARAVPEADADRLVGQTIPRKP